MKDILQRFENKLMQQKHTSKLESLVKFFNRILHQKSLIILVGKNSSILTALKNKKIEASLEIPTSDLSTLKEYQLFLDLYPKYHVIFLVDSKDTMLSHEMIPMMQSLIKSNPIAHFIAENYPADDIIASDLYNIKDDNGEIWEVAIASCKYTAPLNFILEYVISKGFHFGGVYFLSLEIKRIIDYLLDLKDCSEYKNQMQIFTVITKSSDILITIKHGNNLMDQFSAPYPSDKSDEYVLGTTEQAISDKLLLYKHYITRLELKVTLMFLCDQKMADLYNTLTTGGHKIITITNQDLSDIEDQRFQDPSLIKLFSDEKSFLALNSPLRSITKLSLYNSILFKPLLLLVVGLVVTICTIKYKSFEINQAAALLNEQYYQLSQEYREIQKTTPDSKQAGDLADLYSLKSSINRNIISPFWSVKYLFGLVNDSFAISKVSWNVKNQSLLSPDNKSNILFDLKIEASLYNDLNISITDNSAALIDGYINHLKFIFNGYDIKHKVNSDDILKIQNKVITPVTIVISGKLGGN